MSNCNYCGGLIAEEGKVYGYAGNFCHCTYKNMNNPQIGGGVMIRQQEYIQTANEIFNLKMQIQKMHSFLKHKKMVDEYLEWSK